MATDDNMVDMTGEQAVAEPVEARPAPTINRYLEAVTKFEGSDLHLKADAAPRIRKAGKLRQVTGPALTQQDMERIVKEILDEDQWQTFTARGSFDLAYALTIRDRFRMNIFRQRGQISLAARRINPKIPTYEELHLPPILEKIADNEQGLVLVCGITGSGKSTTLAAMIEQINERRACHIITVEEPIEYLYVDNKAYVNQREIGLDVESYEAAIHSLVREDPDVILIGEMRDRNAFQTALQAAETGHLVFSTVHASSAPGAITRVLELFPQEMHPGIRQALVSNLKAVVYQRLVRSILPGVERVPVMEILLSSPSVRKYIEEGRESELINVIRGEKGAGMVDFNDMLAELVQKEVVNTKDAYAASPNQDELRMRMRGIKAG